MEPLYSALLCSALLYPSIYTLLTKVAEDVKIKTNERTSWRKKTR